MKKFLAIFAVAGTLVACNSSEETKTETKDTQNVIEQKAPDTAKVVTTTTTTTDTTHKEGTDTTKH